MKFTFLFAFSLFTYYGLSGQSQLLFDEIRLTDAREEFGLTGEGAVVAIIDRGIDYRHPDFRKEDGTTRILAIWDLSDNSGASAANNPYGVGTIYEKEKINNALSTGIPLATRDASGHGTVTAGVAAGNGSASVNGTEGVAPNADIVVVKFTSEGAPAHGDQPAEASFYASQNLEEAIEFIKMKASEVGKPVSMIANFGSIQGPMDGTSRDSRIIDSQFSDTDQGVAFICGSSDDGGLKNHASSTLVQGEPIEIKIMKKTSHVRFDMWYPDSDDIAIEVISPGDSKSLAALSGPGDTKSISGADFTVYHQGSELDYFGADNAKNEILIDFHGANGEITIKLNPLSIENGKWDASLNPSNIFLSEPNEFQNYFVDGTIWDLASAKNNICPNSYILRDNWQAIDGGTYSYPGHENGVGSLWTGSGIGPTTDGRIGIDVSVPGNINFGAYAPESYFATLNFNLVEEGEFPYGVIAAVSGANPVLAGVVALMLEANPELSNPEIKRILQKTAKMDQSTGAVPNHRWGYGKLDVMAALNEVYFPTSTQTVAQQRDINIYPNPGSNTISILTESNSKNSDIEIYDSTGKLTMTCSAQREVNGRRVVDISTLEAGIYFIAIDRKSKGKMARFIKI